jgi:hypothetical protein
MLPTFLAAHPYRCKVCAICLFVLKYLKNDEFLENFMKFRNLPPGRSKIKAVDLSNPPLVIFFGDTIYP